jgi:hypothetical protein
VELDHLAKYMSSLRRSTVSFKTITNVARWSCECWPEPGLVVMVAGAGLVFSPPSGPGVAELAGGGGHGRGGQAQEPAGFGDADLDHAGVVGWRLVRAGREDPGVSPGRGLGGGGGRAGACGLW